MDGVVSLAGMPAGPAYHTCSLACTPVYAPYFQGSAHKGMWGMEGGCGDGPGSGMTDHSTSVPKQPCTRDLMSSRQLPPLLMDHCEIKHPIRCRHDQSYNTSKGCLALIKSDNFVWELYSNQHIAGYNDVQCSGMRQKNLFEP